MAATQMETRERPAHKRPFTLTHQTLCIRSVNFQKQLIIGLVDINLIPQKNNINKIKLNFKQGKIYRLALNDTVECQFSYHDPSLEICQDESRQRAKTVDAFSQAHFAAVNAVNSDRGRGELIVDIPPSHLHQVIEGRPIKLTVEFIIERPLSGIHFVSSPDGTFSGTQHMFTSAHENSARLWFPCVDSYSEPCTWKIEVTVDAQMTAIAPGDLLETCYSENMKKKTFHYELKVPTSAPNIGLTVGQFEILVDPFMNEVTYFCLPHLKPLLKDTCSFLHEAFEFYEELLSARYPYTSYKQVFVDEAYAEVQSYATMTIFDTNLLHSKHIIEQTYKTREVLSDALARQYFGCYIAMSSSFDSWLTRGISAFLGFQYFKKAFGNNEYRTRVYHMLNEVIEYEQKFGGILLDPWQQPQSDNMFYFSNRNMHTWSPFYDEIYSKKSFLIIRMLDDRIGKELLLQVFNKLLTLATVASQQQLTAATANAWSNMLLSTSSFSKAIFTVTGKDITTFLQQWVHTGGHSKFNGSFVFNRKRNTVELEIKQLDTSLTGIRRYNGPLTVWVQELDGTFKHNLQIEETVTKHDITCHSKSRRNKRKKIPLCTSEEVDMDLADMDADSPVLWIRLDPDMQLMRQVVFEQTDAHWQYQLRYERDVTAQLQAIAELERHPTQPTRKALNEIMENAQCFYRVRCAAMLCFRSIANQMATQWSAPPLMMAFFKKMFGSFSCPNIPKLNNFSNFQHYYLQKTMPLAMAGLRSAHGICPGEVVRFLLDLFKYNDNSKNKFSDCFYRATLIEALAETVTPAVSAVIARSGQQTSSEALPSETKLILEEITRYFNLDKLMPCYKFTVTKNCLRAIRRLQKMGHLPSNSAFFKEYAAHGVFIEVRMTAIEMLVDITRAEQKSQDLDFLLDIAEADPSHPVRIHTLKQLCLNPPFTRKDMSNQLNTESLVERIWRLMNSNLSHDSRLRSALVDLYYTLFGRTRPAVLPKNELSLVVNLKERKTISQLSEEKPSRASELFDQVIFGSGGTSTARPSETPSSSFASNASGPPEKRMRYSESEQPMDQDHHTLPFASPTKTDSVSLLRPAGSSPSTSTATGLAPTERSPVQPSTSSVATLGGGDQPDGSAPAPPTKEKKDKHRDKERSEKKDKPHKDKKKKKKKHKHKHKHKHHHGDKERDRSSAGGEGNKEHRDDRHSSLVSDEASNPSAPNHSDSN